MSSVAEFGGCVGLWFVDLDFDLWIGCVTLSIDLLLLACLVCWFVLLVLVFVRRFISFMNVDWFRL